MILSFKQYLNEALVDLIRSQYSGNDGHIFEDPDDRDIRHMTKTERISGITIGPKYWRALVHNGKMYGVKSTHGTHEDIRHSRKIGRHEGMNLVVDHINKVITSSHGQNYDYEKEPYFKSPHFQKTFKGYRFDNNHKYYDDDESKSSIDEEKGPRDVTVARKILQRIKGQKRFSRSWDDTLNEPVDANQIKPLIRKEDFPNHKFRGQDIKPSHWEEHGRLMHVPLDKLVTHQDAVHVPTLDAKLRGSFRNPIPKHPYVAYSRKHDKFYNYDGNHRASRARLLRRPTMLSKVIEVDDD